mgnify:CR=1 FL=1
MKQLINRVSLSLPLFLTILLPIVGTVVLSVLVVDAFDRARGVAITVQEQDLDQLVQLTGRAIDELWIEPRSEMIERLSRADVLRRRLQGAASFDELVREWRAARPALGDYFYIYYGLQDGRIELYPDDPLPPGYDHRTRPWYRRGMASEGGAVWTAPYREIITGQVIVSTVVPLFADGAEPGDRPIGVFAADVTFEDLTAILHAVDLPGGGAVFLLDALGNPFVGTDATWVNARRLPSAGTRLFVNTGEPLSNGWRVAVVVPRSSLAATFDRLRRPILGWAVAVVAVVAVVLALLVMRTATRAHRLARYFQLVEDESVAPRTLFRTRDEFSFLNERFNRAVDAARSARRETVAREETFRFLVEDVPVGYFRCRTDGQLLDVNRHCAEMLGYSHDAVPQEVSSITDLYHDSARRREIFRDLMADGEVHNRKVRFESRDGQPVWLSMTACLDRGASTASSEIRGFLIDVTADVMERNELHTLAQYDALTGAANRRAFDEAIARTVDAAVDAGGAVGLVLFDIDEFKRINDTWGHDVGDRTLSAVVISAGGILRSQDTLARLGGDEFAVLLPGADEDAAYGLAIRIREAVRNAAFPSDLPTAPTLSIGVSAATGAVIEPGDLMKRADVALYRAKHSGRDEIVRASRSDDTSDERCS